MLICSICSNIRQRITFYHHVIPLKKGGKDIEGNKIPVCKACHQAVERQTIGRIMRITLNLLGKDQDWFFLRLAELGVTTNPYWNKPKLPLAR